MAKEVLNYKTLEERRTQLGLKKRKKGFYTVVFYPLKTGKKVTVNSISEVEALVRKAGGKFPGIMGTRKELAITDNKLYFYKKTTNWSSAKEIGYLKCNDFDKLLNQVYGGYRGKAHDYYEPNVPNESHLSYEQMHMRVKDAIDMYEWK